MIIQRCTVSQDQIDVVIRAAAETGAVADPPDLAIMVTQLQSGEVGVVVGDMAIGDYAMLTQGDPKEGPFYALTMMWVGRDGQPRRNILRHETIQPAVLGPSDHA